MAENDNELSVALPPTLRQQFGQVERRLWRVETTVAVCRILGALAASFLALFLADRFWDTPVAIRFLILALGLGVSFGAAYRWMRNWIFQRRDLRALAGLVQKKYRRLGDRLLGIVELANEQRHAANFSPALYRAAIGQVAAEAQAFDFPASVNISSARRSSAVLLGLAAVLLLAAVVLPQASWNAFCRWMAPASALPRYTLVNIDKLPAQLIVAHGEPFALEGAVEYRAFWKPRSVIAQIPRQPKIESSVQAGAFRIQIPGQMEEGAVLVKIGDARRQVQILPRYRPALKELSATIQLPEYLRYPEQTEPVRNGTLALVEGSRFSLRAKFNRPLSEARLQSDSQSLLPLKIQGDSFASDSTSVDSRPQFSLSWRDTLGLSNAAPLRLSVLPQKDSPPSADLPDLPRAVVMLDSDILQIRVEARDDFGVSDLGLVWEALSDTPASGAGITEIKVLTSSHQQKKAEKTFRWSPSLFRIPPDSTVELQGYARDYFPERERSMTPLYRIQVLSPENHAEMLRQRLEALQAGVEEAARLQEKVVNNTREAGENESLTEAQKNARLNQSKDDQLQNAANLEQMAREGRQTMQEAMKNPLVPEDSVRDFARSIQEWQKLSQDKMPDAAQSLKSAQQNAKSRQQDLADALRKEEEILKALEAQQNKNSENLDQLQAMTLAQRLRKVAARQTEASDRLLNCAQDTIGLLPDELPKKFKDLEAGLATGQAAVQKDSDALRTEISRFFERTQKTNYGQVSAEMKEARIPEELETLSGMIRDNVAMESSGALTNWARRFQDWGDKLEPKPDSSSSKGNSGQGESMKKLDLGKQLIALLRLREKESTLREQTSLLDQQKGDSKNYTEQALALQKTQSQLSDTLGQIHQDTPVSAFDAPFGETAAAMQEADAFLQKPQTDQATDQAQAKSIDLLTDLVNLINEQAQKSSSQSNPQQPSESSAEEMAFLTQMMKESSPNNGKPMTSPGSGNTAGGGTGRPGAPVTGNVRGKGPGARAVNKAAGVIENSPAEFREALENYYRAIENNRGTK